MERSTPWLIAALSAVVGGSVWFYRIQRTEADSPPPGREIVANAWGPGRKVPLRGRQEIQMPGRDNQPLKVDASVLYSRDGKMRIEYLSKPILGVKVWENGDRTYRFNPRLKRLTVARKRGTLDERFAKELSLLERNYASRVVGPDEVAGRPAWIVELRPQSGGELWKRLWVDKRYWVVLRSEDLQGNKALRRTTYQNIQYLDPKTELADSEFHPPQALIEQYGRAVAGGSDRFDDLGALSSLVGFKIRSAQALPKGYEFEGAYQIPCICGASHRAVRLEYSDGLNKISVFEAGYPGCAAPKPGFSRGGPIAVRLARGGVYYWTIGALPHEKLMRILESTAASGPSQP